MARNNFIGIRDIESLHVGIYLEMDTAPETNGYNSET